MSSLLFPKSGRPRPATSAWLWQHGLLAGTLLMLTNARLISSEPATGPLLQIQPHDTQGWLRISAHGPSNSVYTLHASTNLADWSAIATAHDGLSAYPDAASSLLPRRFYRLSTTSQTGEDDWKNQVRLPNDPFLSDYGAVSGPDFRWIKFAVPFAEPFRIYYQDSKKYDFHYDFATKRLAPFKGMTPVEFDQVALRTNGQQVLLGTLLIPPFPNEAEYGIQFVGQDAYPSELIAGYFDLVRATVVTDPTVRAFYVPTFEQTRAAEADRAYFESRGIALASADRWLSGNNIYSAGWALGRLKFFTGTEIANAFRDGRLQPGDILLTDGVPAEIPVLAGVLTMSPSTPNSHVAILAKSFGLPFAYLSEAAQRERVQALVGKDIVLRLDSYYFDIKVLELDASTPSELREEILSLKSPPKLNITPKAKYGKLSASTDALTPADIQYFGGKASNFGFLRREIPDHAPTAIALSFDLWDAFLEQVLPGGRTLRAEIESRLSGYTYPANLEALQRDLAEIRALITGTAQFTAAQKEAILEALNGFEPGRKVRFRSSTNVEDSEQFTGAGLYDSYSGCPADDLDSDSEGPSRCDPEENSERGVFRAIQKVYASFYNDNAFIERLRHGLDENAVGMAVLVHYSAPDDTELANGVATLNVQRSSDSNSLDGDLVTQKGPISVTNPDGTAKPEVVQGYHYAFGAGGFLKERSSLVPLGAYVMEWDKDYVDLMKLFARVADGFHTYFPHKTSFTLDFEYKKLVPGMLSIKQVREVPVLPPSTNLPRFLLHQTNSYWVMQGEAAAVFSNHRLKSFWSFTARNMKLAQTNLNESLFTRLDGAYLEDGRPVQITGSPTNLPNSSHTVAGELVSDRWTSGTGENRRDFELRTDISRFGFPTEAPVLTLNDFRMELLVTYATPQPALRYDFEGLKPVMVTNETVVLEPRRVLTGTNYLQHRTASAPGLAIDTEFYWPVPPSKGIGEKTAPLAQWKETRITGLTPEPILLRGEYSQTYRPGHHNFTEEFIFEPSLEEGLSPAVLAALKSSNVRLIHFTTGFQGAQINLLGLDGKFRTLEAAGKGGKTSQP